MRLLGNLFGGKGQTSIFDVFFLKHVGPDLQLLAHDVVLRLVHNEVNLELLEYFIWVSGLHELNLFRLLWSVKDLNFPLLTSSLGERVEVVLGCQLYRLRHPHFSIVNDVGHLLITQID